MKRNITLIGMAGVGKSFISKTLASELNYEYVSDDELISFEATKIGKDKNLLSDTVFMGLEENIVVGLKDKSNLVIDTGGSIVYSSKAMDILNEISFVVYLSDSVENIKKRFDARGEPHLIGMAGGMTFAKLLAQREILYEKYAHVKIDVSEYKEGLVRKILTEYKKFK